MSKLMKSALVFLLAAVPALAQHEHHAMSAGSPATLSVTTDAAAHVLVAKLGPLNLPAHTGHAATAQPAPQFLTIPFDGWLAAYHPALVDEQGHAVPARMLHHVAFWNTARPDFLCPNKDEHIFGAGGEMNDWPALPGFGYRVHPGDRIRVTSMFHNPTDTSYPRVYLVVRIEYREQGAGPALASVYPAWFDVKQCGESSFPVPPDGLTLTGHMRVDFTGRLLGVGGHMHDYGESLELDDATQKEQVAALKSQLDPEGHILSMPVVTFAERGGFLLKKGDLLDITVRYGRPGEPKAEGMGIVVGYFLPENDAAMQALTRRERPNIVTTGAR